MATRFSASDARKQTELAKQRIDTERKAASEKKKLQAKKKAAINASWEKQRIEILSAAVDGKHEHHIENAVYKFMDLVDLGLKVIETGLVKYQFNGRDAQADKVKLEKLHERIFNSFNEFIDASKNDMSEYYGGTTVYFKTLNEELYENISADFFSDFLGDDVMWNEVPEEISHRYVKHFAIISERIKAYKDFKEVVDFGMEDDSEVDVDVLVNSEYIYSDDDVASAVLTPTKVGNKLRITWSADLGAAHMNDPLFSDEGLTWLSSDTGQELLTSIFESLRSAAASGKTDATLTFELAHDGWFFKPRHGDSIYSCMPDEVVELIALEGFNVADTDSTETSYKIFVTW
jgi:hypothetical protein